MFHGITEQQKFHIAGGGIEHDESTGELLAVFYFNNELEKLRFTESELLRWIALLERGNNDTSFSYLALDNLRRAKDYLKTGIMNQPPLSERQECLKPRQGDN
jgi:hypothetical protein